MIELHRLLEGVLRYIRALHQFSTYTTYVAGKCGPLNLPKQSWQIAIELHETRSLDAENQAHDQVRRSA